MTPTFKEKLKKIIEEEFPNIDKLTKDEKSFLFYEMFLVLSDVMKRDFTYGLQILEKASK